MTDLTLTLQIVALVVLLTLSACFDVGDGDDGGQPLPPALLANQGSRAPPWPSTCLARTDRLLGVILLFNNLVNTGAATLVSVITLELFGNESWILGVATLLATFAILVFSEITPKVVGANHADRLALRGLPITGLLRASYFAVWFINLFSRGLLNLMRLQPKEETKSALSVEELRAMVIESGQYIPHKHRSMLLNLFDLSRASRSRT